MIQEILSLAEMIISIFIILCTCMVVFLILIEFIQSKITNYKERVINEKVLRELSEIQRWCGSEFPLVELTCQRILNIINKESYPSIEYFREELRNFSKEE